MYFRYLFGRDCLFYFFLFIAFFFLFFCCLFVGLLLCLFVCYLFVFFQSAWWSLDDQKADWTRSSKGSLFIFYNTNLIVIFVLTLTMYGYWVGFFSSFFSFFCRTKIIWANLKTMRILFRRFLKIFHTRQKIVSDFSC